MKFSEEKLDQTKRMMLCLCSEANSVMLCCSEILRCEQSRFFFLQKIRVDVEQSYGRTAGLLGVFFFLVSFKNSL